MNQQLTMNVRPATGASVIEIHGELNASADGVLSDAYTQASEREDVIILNFEGLEYMNSSGIGLLVTLLIRANRQKKRLMICGLTDHYRHIFQITRLDDAIAIYDTESDALAAVG